MINFNKLIVIIKKLELILLLLWKTFDQNVLLNRIMQYEDLKYLSAN